MRQLCSQPKCSGYDLKKTKRQKTEEEEEEEERTN
jgi:hypothetical protein